MLHSGIAERRDCAGAAFTYLWVRSRQSGSTQPPLKGKDMSTVHEVTHYAPSLGNRVARYAAELAVRYGQYRTFRQTLEELSSLSDRDLTDLGLSRGNLRAIAYQAAYGS